MTTIRYDGVTLPDDEQDVEISLTVSGDPENDVEKVALHARDEAVKAMQALHEGGFPEEQDGVPVSVNWDKVVSENGGEDGD